MAKETKQPLVWINGNITSPSDAKISVFDRGFLFGDGVYETGKALNRCFILLEEHLDRLRRSSAKLSIALPWTDSQITEGLYATARQFDEPELYFRTIVTRGMIDHVGLDVATVGRPTLVHVIQKLPDLTRLRKEGLSVLTSKIERNSVRAQDPNIKTSNYLNCLLALQDVRQRGADDAILCDPQGNVTEGTTFSIFGITAESTLITPALSIGILDSITRRHVIDLAKRESIAVKEGAFSVAKFLECREVFVASSVREVVPVRSWDAMDFPGVPGPLTSRLADVFFAEIGKYIATHDKY